VKDKAKEQLIKELRQRIAELEKSETQCERVEKTLKRQAGDLQEPSTEDVQSLVHELEVHQTELEMQNEELRRAQIKLEESHNRYSNLYDFAPVGYFSFDKNGLIIGVNLTGAHKLGVERSFLIKKPFSLYIMSDSKDVFYSHLRKVFNTENPQTCELKLVDKNGIQFDAQLESLLVKDSENKFGLCQTAISDITERKYLGDALRKTHDELEIRVQERTTELAQANEDLKAKIAQIREQASLLDKAQDAIAVRDLEHHLIYWSKGAQHLYGWTAEEVIDKNADELLYKEESLNLIKAKKDVIEKGEWIDDLHQVTKDGKEIIVESRWSLIRDSEEKPKSILIINTDITEKKMLEAQLLRAQRMESIGTLAGGMAHDLNNVMTPIMLSVHLLKEKVKDEQSQKILTILEKNSQRGANLINQVMFFARGVEGERKPLQISHIIYEIETVIKETFPKSIESKTDIQKELSNISGDSTQLHQVLMNLCVNARDAMQDGGILSIFAENFFIDENYARMNVEAKVGSYVVITVSDTGTGIPPKIIDRIYEPFFTTKGYGKGTGLGLSTSLGIVKSHGGFINVYSELGKGTKFSIYLPAITTNEGQKAQDEPKFLSVQGELILLVDDEAPIREIARATLEAYRYRVITANDGAEAITLYAQNIEEIRVVLMDMSMPKMDGLSSIRVIRKINPNVKIIAVSGLTEKTRLTKLADINVNSYLPKPCTAEKLLKTIHEVLSAK
jgi:PAS domain S-box-containing protein